MNNAVVLSEAFKIVFGEWAVPIGAIFGLAYFIYMIVYIIKYKRILFGILSIVLPSSLGGLTFLIDSTVPKIVSVIYILIILGITLYSIFCDKKLNYAPRPGTIAKNEKTKHTVSFGHKVRREQKKLLKEQERGEIYKLKHDRLNENLKNIAKRKEIEARSPLQWVADKPLWMQIIAAIFGYKKIKEHLNNKNAEGNKTEDTSNEQYKE